MQKPLDTMRSKKPELLSLKPLNSISSTNLKTILPCIDPPPAFKSGGFSHSVQNPNTFTPISLGGFKVPEAPKLSKLSKSSNPKGFERALGSTFIKSYNSLMNQLKSEGSEENEENEGSEGDSAPETINPLIEAEIRSEELESNNSSEDPKNSEDLKDPTFVSPKNHILENSRKDLNLEHSPNSNLSTTTVVKEEKQPKPLESKGSKSLKLFELLEDSEPLLRPKTEGSEDLDEELIETIKVTRKECKVFDSLESSSKLCSYAKIRDNTDNLIFCIQELQKQSSKESYKFYSYSKLEIYNQYSKCHSQMYFHLKIRTYKESINPTGSIESDDLEIFWIPMIQIVRLLEYSHPVYEIEKTKFSMNLYNLKPVRLSK